MQDLFLGKRTNSVWVWKKSHLLRGCSPYFLDVVIRTLLLRFSAHQNRARGRIENGRSSLKIRSGGLPETLRVSLFRVHHREKWFVPFGGSAFAFKVSPLSV